LVLTAAEEQGSRGSLHMTSWMTDAGVDVRGVIAPDMIGYWPLGDDDAMDILGDTGSSHLADQMASVADALGVPYKKFIEHSYCYGDDHTNFQEAGFPAIAPMDCVEAHNLPGMGEETPHYHRESDTVDTLYLPFTKRVVEVQIATFAMWGEPL
jgi:Zn-dependent M28 family amino/carboxypeptidase